MIISQKLKEKSNNTILISDSYLKNIHNVEKIGENLYKLNKSISKSDCEDYFYECFYWIKKFVLKEKVISLEDLNKVEDLSNLYVYERILLIIFTFIINFKDNISKKLLEIISEVLTSIYLPSFLMNKINKLNKAKNFWNFISNIKEKSQIKILIDIIFDNKTKNLLIDIFPYEKFSELEVKCNSKQIDANYIDCDSLWLIDNWKIAQRIMAKKILKNFIINKKKLIRKRIEKKKSNAIILTSLSMSIKRLISKEYIISLIPFFINNGFCLEIFIIIDEIKEEILKGYYKFNISNSIDFHYIILQLMFLSKKLEEYNTFLRENIDKNDSKIFLVEFVKVKKELETFKLQFLEWKAIKAIKHEEPKSFKKNKQILAIKIARKGFLNKFQLIAQKRANLKKQMYLKVKAEKLKRTLK